MQMKWLNRTGQAWKVALFGFFMAIEMILFGAFMWRINLMASDSPTWLPDEVVLALSFVGVGWIAFAVLWFSIKCPICGGNVGSLILKTRNIGGWFTELISLQRCPHCGNQG